MAVEIASSLRDQTPRRRKRPLPGVTREDSDDELGTDDLPWEWIHEDQPSAREDGTPGERKRRKVTGNKIVGARLGTFECRVGDTVMLKADGSNEAWVAIICDFIEDNGEGEKAANFMWFCSEKEIRDRVQKRKDFYWVWIEAHFVIATISNSLPERALHLSIMGREPPRLDQRESKRHVSRGLPLSTSHRQNPSPLARLRQDLRLPPRLQHPNRHLHR